jgi:hypothetical protein
MLLTTNCHNDLHSTKSWTWLGMNKREVTDLVQGTWWKSQLHRQAETCSYMLLNVRNRLSPGI